jgi:hypothetical protein
LAILPVRLPPLDGFDGFAREVTRRYPGFPPVSHRWVARRAHLVGMVARYFEGVMRRTDARAAFCTVYYAFPGVAWCLAARRCGIPAVDVQHGVTLRNPAYEGWSRFPADGYELLPEVFWCWSDADAAPVRAWPAAGQRRHRTVVGGHPWTTWWEHDGRERASRRSETPGRGQGLTVLVTLTWSSGFSELLRQTILASPPEWTWWVRLHPMMDRDRTVVAAWCARHAPERTSIAAATDAPLPALLEAADVHVTHNSTVVQEAARVGVPSVVIDRRALDVYVDELASGYACFADGPADIIAALSRQHDRRGTLPRAAPPPSWSAMTHVVLSLVQNRVPCPATASAASSPTHVRA